QTLRFGDAWARLGPWRGGGRVAHLVVNAEAPLGVDAVLDCVRRAQAAGYAEVLTSAVGPSEEAPFMEASFAVRERLRLLSCDLSEEPERPSQRVARCTRR